ncbi:MAG: hypothetical protein A2939_00575 [Parcubacteria group bacterium RIFCSPLOWO2_01_FULL_48_18]|nr:MAG: hypothetical protein A2939_00575 [Parcubacteria group bacterium RIFCSPLOWO2_01_FULL_48_18]
MRIETGFRCGGCSKFNEYGKEKKYCAYCSREYTAEEVFSALQREKQNAYVGMWANRIVLSVFGPILVVAFLNLVGIKVSQDIAISLILVGGSLTSLYALFGAPRRAKQLYPETKSA